ncbi:MAG: hypothetical protein CMK92_02225 [Pseudomonas sp.]|nr:hypothetical protein [Pseudomonas sp.]
MDRSVAAATPTLDLKEYVQRHRRPRPPVEPRGSAPPSARVRAHPVSARRRDTVLPPRVDNNDIMTHTEHVQYAGMMEAQQTVPERRVVVPDIPVPDLKVMLSRDSGVEELSELFNSRVTEAESMKASVCQAREEARNATYVPREYVHMMTQHAAECEAKVQVRAAWIRTIRDELKSIVAVRSERYQRCRAMGLNPESLKVGNDKLTAILSMAAAAYEKYSKL